MQTNLLLREKDKERLIHIFSQIDYPFEIWAYGSRVNGDAHSGSDLDLVIRGEAQQPIPSELVREIAEEIEDSNIPILVELRDWNRIPEYFHKNILANYSVLYSNFITA
jgi:predicted nucleotidyltransferase